MDLSELEKAIAETTSPRLGLAELRPLLERCFTEAGSNDARQVLADMLLERGCPLGEVLALQLRRADRPSSTRERQLLRWWELRWRALYGPRLAWARLTRGFVSEGRLKAGQEPLSEAWQTLERLEVSVKVGPSELLSPALRHVREVRGVSLEALLRCLEQRPLEWVKIVASERRRDSGAFVRLTRLLESSPNLPALESFCVQFWDGQRFAEAVEASSSPAWLHARLTLLGQLVVRRARGDLIIAGQSRFHHLAQPWVLAELRRLTSGSVRRLIFETWHNGAEEPSLATWARGVDLSPLQRVRARLGCPVLLRFKSYGPLRPDLDITDQL